MKKVEAKSLAPIKSRYILEKIESLLSLSEVINAKMEFWTAKIDGQDMCTLDIYAREIGLEEHINLGITLDHKNVLCKQIFDDFINTFLAHKTLGVTKYYSIKSMLSNFSGVYAFNANGSKISIDFKTTNPEFMDMALEYNKIYSEYVESLKNQDTSVKRHS